MDEVLQVEVDPRAQPIRTQTGGAVPTVSFEQPVAVAGSSSAPLPHPPRPFATSRVYTPLPRAQHPSQPMPFSGPSVTGVNRTIGMFQDTMQEFLRERRERIARADLPRGAPPGPIPSEAGRSLLGASTAPAPGSQEVKPAVVPSMMRTQPSVPLPPVSTVLPTRPATTVPIAAPSDGANALARPPLHAVPVSLAPESPAATAPPQTAQPAPPPSASSGTKPK